MEKECRTLLSVIDVDYSDVRALLRCAASEVFLDSQRFSTVLRCLKGVTEVSQKLKISPIPSCDTVWKTLNYPTQVDMMSIWITQGL